MIYYLNCVVNRHEKQEGENERMNDNFNNDKWTEKAVWIKKEPLSSDAVLSDRCRVKGGIYVFNNVCDW